MNETPPVADFSVKPTLEGDVVRLRPFVDADLAVMRAAVTDPEVITFTGGATTSAAPVHDEAEETRLREWYATRNDQTDRLDLAVVDRGTDECVGEVVLNTWDEDNLSCNFRILLAAAGRGRGLGTEATRLVVGYGFEQLGLHRISLGVFAFNPRARRAYEKVGFVTEGVLRDELRLRSSETDGEWVDGIVMSILDHEWSRHRGHPELPL